MIESKNKSVVGKAVITAVIIVGSSHDNNYCFTVITVITVIKYPFDITLTTLSEKTAVIAQLAVR